LPAKTRWQEEKVRKGEDRACRQKAGRHGVRQAGGEQSVGGASRPATTQPRRIAQATEPAAHSPQPCRPPAPFLLPSFQPSAGERRGRAA